MKIDLTGKIALVTGGSGELGRAMVRALAECGASVAIHYHSNAGKANELRAGIMEAGGRAATVQGDITVEADVLRMREEIADALGSPDILVNNALISYPEWLPVIEQPLEDYESQFRCCVLQSVLTARAFVPAMIERRWGRVIGISTEAAVLCGARMSAYTSGKRGMDGVLRTLAREVAEFNITVNEVAPGWTISDLDRARGSERNEKYESVVPMGRRGTDVEVANVVAFLASDLASFVTGAFVPVSGGTVMPGI